MFRVFNAEARARHSFLDTVQVELESGLKHPDVREFFGEDTCDNFLGITHNLVAPNIKSSGRIAYPTKAGSEFIPIVAMDPGEKLVVDEKFWPQTPFQQEKSYQSLTEDLDMPGFKALLVLRRIREDHSVIAKNASEIQLDDHGSVISKNLVFSSDLFKPEEEARFRGRPFVALRKNLSKPLGQLTLMHELEHVRQRIEEPVTFGSKENRDIQNIVDELKAYFYEAHFARTLVDAESLDVPEEFYNDAVIVDAFRYKYASDKNPFYPNKNLLVALRDAGLLYRVDRRETSNLAQ